MTDAGHLGSGAVTPVRAGLLALGAPRSALRRARRAGARRSCSSTRTCPEVGDASAYHLLANNLADGRGYIRPFDLVKFGRVVPTAEYPPLLPVRPVAVRPARRAQRARRSGSGWRWSAAAPSCSSRYIGRRVAGTAVGVVAGVLAAVYPMLFLAEATLMSESLFVVLRRRRAAARVRRAPTGPTRCASPRSASCSASRRSPAPRRSCSRVFLVVPLAWRLARRRRSCGGIGLAALVFAVAAVVVVPWSIRNARTFHEFVPGLEQPRCRSSTARTAGSPTPGRSSARGARRSATPTRTAPSASRASTAASPASTRRRPPTCPAATASTTSATTSATCRRSRVGPPAAGPSALFRPAQQTQLEALEGRPLGWERAGTVHVLGARAARDRRARRSWSAGGRPVWPLAAAVLTVVVSTVLTYGTQRFRITAEPAILVLAAAALVAIARPARGAGPAPAPPQRSRLTGRRPAVSGGSSLCCPTMLWLERQVVATLAADVDHRTAARARGLRRRRAARHARAPPPRRRGRVDRARQRCVARRPARLAAQPAPTGSTAGSTAAIGPIRQYVRLLSSLVIFAERGARARAAGRATDARDDARDRDPRHRLRRRRRGHRGDARPRRPLGHGRRGRPVGRPRRGRAVLARRDGAEVPPPGRVRRARHARASRTPRAAASAGAPRSTAACTTASRPSSPTSGARPTASPSSRPRCSTGTRTEVENELVGRRTLPGAPPPSSAVLERGAAKLGWRAVEFARVFSVRQPRAAASKQTMARTLIPRAIEAGAQIIAECRVVASCCKRDDRIVGARGASARCPDGDDRAAHDPRRARLRVRRRDPDARRCCSAAASGARSATG